MLVAIGAVPIIGKPQPPSNWEDLGDAWATFVYNYQTLITGILAVGAAWRTIKQMQETDRAAYDRHFQAREDALNAERSAQKRHEELQDLSLRRDRLLVDRAVEPQLLELASAMGRIGEIADGLSTGVNPPEYLRDGVRSFLTAIEWIMEILNRQQIKDAMPLFDGTTLFFRNLALERADEMQAVLSDALEVYQSLRVDEASYRPFIESLQRLSSDVYDHVDGFYRGLESLRKEYE